MVPRQVGGAKQWQAGTRVPRNGHLTSLTPYGCMGHSPIKLSVYELVCGAPGLIHPGSVAGRQRAREREGWDFQRVDLEGIQP
jgi:hypothetical protein